ncbi:MAG: nucleoside-diphosphate kinase [Holosporaceae bacterium]|nr:nucleoside-diphosphate kinase [Holosporaceae bacterium]
MEKTLSIIKPDAVARNITGKVNDRLETVGLKIVAQKKLLLTKAQVEKFYEIHKDKAFYDSICEYMSSGPVVVQVLAGPDAVEVNRKAMGATNPANAEVGSIRRDFGESIERNVVHGSDSNENAVKEIAFFFSGIEIIE